MPGESSAQQPAIVVCAACITGVLLDRWLAPGALIWTAAIATAMVFWTVAHRRRAVVYGALSVLLALLATTGLWHHMRWRLFYIADVALLDVSKPAAICLEGWTYSPPRHQPAPPPDPLSSVPAVDESRFLLIVERVRDKQHWRPSSGAVAVSVKGKLTNVECGDRILVFGMLSTAPAPLNPGERSVADFERAERRLCRMHINHTDCIQILQRRAQWRPVFWLHWLRTRFEDSLRRYVPGPRAGLACAILLGTREDVDRVRNEEFMVTGTVHLLAISGLNVGILAYTFWVAGRLGLIGRAFTLSGGIAFVVWYALLTDAQPPVIRAAVLVAVMCFARLCGRQSLNFNTLAVAGMVVLILNPANVFMIGTQLSFLAVVTMAWVPNLIPGSDQTQSEDPLQQLIRTSRSWPERFARGLIIAVWDSIVLSSVIWLISLPLVMYHFHVVSPIATVLNPVVCLPMAIALFAGFGVMIFGFLAPPLAAACGFLCDRNLWLMEYSIDQALKIPVNHFWGPAPPAWWVVIFYAGLFVNRSFTPFRNSIRWSLAALIAWLGLGTWMTFGGGARANMHDDQLRCTFIAVGHGTCALLELPGGKTLLYDAGKLGFARAGGQTISAVLWSRGLTHLDAIVISHADADHFNAVPFLLDRFTVGAIYVSPTMFLRSQSAVTAFRSSVELHRIELRFLSRDLQLSGGDAVDLRVLHPESRGSSGSDNANSIVLLVEFAGRKLLLPGDLESPGTEELLATAPIDCDVLMAPHHGSIRSNPSDYIRWSTPEFVVISGSGKRDSSALVHAYERAGARVFHTAFDGAVEISIAQDSIDVHTFVVAGLPTVPPVRP